MFTLPLQLLTISLLSFLLPTQIGLHLNSLSSSVIGFNIDYLLPTIYLTDIVALLAIIVNFKNVKTNTRFVLISILYLFFVILNVYYSELQIASIYKWLRISELLLLGVVIFNNKKIDIFKNFVNPLSYSVFLTSLLGIFQFVNKGSIGGLFYYLGERSFVFSDPNIAPYPYSTFSHPNSFAGFLLVFVFFLIKYKRSFNQKYFWTLLALVVTNLFLTNSLNIFLTIGILLILHLRSNKLFALFPLDFGARFVTHRVELTKASLIMIKENLMIGVGLNNFIPNLVKVSNTYINSWELQPVHNIYLLIFSETGLIGFIVFVSLIFSSASLTNYPLLAILITGLNDHYWLTLQQNMLLFSFVLALTKKDQK